MIGEIAREASGRTETRTFRVSLDEFGAVDPWVERVTSSMRVDKRTAFATRLCIAELATNILEHGVARTQNDHVVIAIDRLPEGSIAVEFLDTREPFDPTIDRWGVQTKSATRSGRGLKLLQVYADDLKYTSEGNYNRVSFRIKPK